MPTELSVRYTAMERRLQPARAPAVGILLAWMAGVLAHGWLVADPGAWLLVAIAAVALAMMFRRSRRACSWLLLIGIAFVAIADAQLEHYQYPATEISLFTADASRLVRLQLRLTDDPVTIPSRYGNSLNQTVPAEAVAIDTRDGWRPATGEIEVDIHHANTRLKVNQVISALGLLGRPAAASNPGQFDYATFDRRRRTLASIMVPRGNTIAIISDPGPTALEQERQAVRQWLTSGFTAGQAVDVALLRSMLLGDHDRALLNVRGDFENAGVAYQLGVGGLHVALLAGCVLLLCRWLRWRPRTQVIVVAAFVVVYALIALPTASGRRAVLLACAAAGAMLVRRQAHRPQLLALTIWGLLVWRPLDLFAPGFELGVVAVFGLVLFSSQARNIVYGLTDQHVALAPQVKRSPLHQGLAIVLAAAIRTGELSIIVWIATLPLLAFYFGQTSVWAVLASIIVLPIAFAALVGGLIKIVLTMWLPPMAHALAMGCDVPVRLLSDIVHGAAGWPGAGFTLAAPTFAMVVAYYLLLLLPMWRWRSRTARVVQFAPLAGVLLIFSTGWVRPSTGGPALRIVLLSIGAGQCAVIEPPDAPPWMFDAGSSTVTDPQRTIVGPYLKHDQRNRLAGIILSHGDYDHISATTELESAFGPMPVYISPHFRRNDVHNLPDQQLLAALDANDDPPRLLSAGDHLALSPSVGVDVLWPPVQGPLNSNNSGLVLRLNYGGRRVLFPADLQNPGFIGLLKNPDRLGADVLVAAHHGSSETLTPDFLKAVHPRIILASSTRWLSKKQRTFDAMTHGTRMYRTGDCGAIVLTITREGRISVQTFLSLGRVKE